MTEKNISIIPKKNNSYKNRTSIFFAYAGAIISCIGFLLLIGSAFPSIKNYIILAFGATLICAGSMFFQKKSFGKYISFAFFVISIAASLVFIELSKNGIYNLVNDFLDFLSLKQGRIYLNLSVEGAASSELVFMVAAAFVVLLLSITVSSKNLISFIPVVLLSFIGCSSGFLSTNVYMIIFFIGALMLTVGVMMPENFASTSIKSIFAAPLYLAICIAVALLPSILVIEHSTGMGDYIKNVFHTAVYDSSSNSMPEGKLTNLGSWNPSEKTALKVKIEQPQKLYLKGFVGETYDGQSWSKLSNDVIYEYSDTFFWLHQNDFYAQKEIYTACSLVTPSVLKTIEVENVSACKKYCFVPYTLADSNILDEYLIGDRAVCSNSDIYSASYFSGGLSEFFNAQIELSNNQKKTEISNYITNESAYRDFVYSNYLDIPETAEAAISYHLKDESSALTFTEIIETILDYLENNIEYDESVVTNNGGTDFIKYFLDSSKRGYSVHYATAATVMLRYFGVPARYVEGYFISAEEAANYGENAEIIIDESHAHAWAEYYLDGVGWIPFEVTPGYIDDELEKASFSFSGESGKIYYQSDKPITNVIQKDKKDNLTELKNSFKFNSVYLLCLFAIIVIALLIYIILKRKKLRKKLDEINSKENKTAIVMQFGYSEMLRLHAKLSVEELNELNYDEIFSINKEALFSEHSMSTEQRNAVFEYSEKILELCKKRWSFAQKFLNRWVKCIYIK